MKIKCCYKCQERHLGCHDTCGRYDAEKKELRRIKEELAKEKHEEDLYWVQRLKHRK